jgi:hypothetical protein
MLESMAQIIAKTDPDSLAAVLDNAATAVARLSQDR